MPEAFGANDFRNAAGPRQQQGDTLGNVNRLFDRMRDEKKGLLLIFDHAQKIFLDIPEGSLELKPLPLDWTFYCYDCGTMASMKTCPHEDPEVTEFSRDLVKEHRDRRDPTEV